MKTVMKMNKLLPFLFLLCLPIMLVAQSPFKGLAATSDFTLNMVELRKSLERAPMEGNGQKSRTTVDIPLPAGGVGTFTAVESPLFSHATIKSYRMNSPWGAGRLSVSHLGVSGVLAGPEGYFVVRRLDDAGTAYAVTPYDAFMTEVASAEGPLHCGYEDTKVPDYGEVEIDPDFGRGGVTSQSGAEDIAKAGNDPRELRVYDLVMTNTFEFARKFGTNPTRDDIRAAFNEAVNAVNVIFENELGVRMNIVDVPALIFINANDPYLTPDMGGSLLGQVLPAFEAAGVAAQTYDLGHIFTAGCSDVGGVVGGQACTAGKTRGVTCVGGTVLGAALRIMTHEIAHQFAVSHSWNNCPGSDNQRAGQTAFEPGAGTTIMSYAGTCGSQNIGSGQSYFHNASVAQFLFYTRQGGADNCATIVATDNFTPEVDFDYEDGFSIPVGTPFRLEGRATDANNDEMTYNWEQFDLGPASDIRSPSGNAPLFRSVAPSLEGKVRYFPNLSRIVNNISNTNEVLPTYTRGLTFRLTARDNNPEAGGVDWKQLEFMATETAGPFVVNNPADSEWNVGDYQSITWEVANTDKAPVNCQRVNILMSTNGGASFDVVLAENVVNSGQAFVTVPEEAISDDVHIMVEAADNVFLNVNNTSFQVQEATQPVFTLEPAIRYESLCLPEVLSVALNSGSVLGFAAPISLSLETGSLPAGVRTTLSATEIMPGDNSILDIALDSVNFTGRTELTIVAVAEGQDTARRVITLDLVSNDYTDLATTGPVEGTRGIILATDFSWTEAVNADRYDIQIATSPDFAEERVFEEATGLTNNTYTPAEFFAPNTLYFWRIRPTNSCGAGNWLPPASFRTVNSQCTRYESTESVTLPGTGPAFTRESTLFVEDQGTINDLNIPNVRLRYNFASKVKITLVSPAKTEVVLYDENCFGSTNRIDLGFDDDAPSAVACPPDDERVFIPTAPLAAFNGENTFGEWILRVQVSETGGSAGAVERWRVEFCADASVAAPEQIINLSTEVPPLGRNSIEGDKLETISPAFGSDGVIYTVTDLPDAGRLLLYGRELVVADTFRQADINGAGLFYENLDATAETDNFGFVVTTPDGGYVAIDYHDFVISENAVVRTNNVSELEDNLVVFPNPMSNQLQLRWTAQLSRTLALELFDLNGRQLRRQTVDGRSGNASLEVAGLPAGVYLLRINGTVRRVAKH